MLEEEVVIAFRRTERLPESGLIISFRGISASAAELVIGRTGVRNFQVELSLGDAVLYETPDGIFEIRLLYHSTAQVELLVTRISPRAGIAAGYIDQNPENIPFSRTEIEQITASLDDIGATMANRSDIKPEQLKYLEEKLDEMLEASERLGRKDWVNYAIGTLTSIVVTAAFDPAAAKALLQTAGAALGWIFGGGFKLLP